MTSKDQWDRSAFRMTISQLESSWGKSRDEWGIAEWRRAALALERSLAFSGEIIEKQGDAVALALQTLAPSQQRKRGRPPKRNRLGMTAVKVRQQLSLRHRNFKQKAKHNLGDMFFLLAIVEAQKLKIRRTGKVATDSGALFELFKKDGERQGVTRQAVKTKLAPMLSKGRRDLKSSGVSDLDAKVKAAVEGLLNGSLK